MDASGMGEGDFHAFGEMMGTHLCADCSDFYTPIQSPLCRICGLPFASRHGVDHECPDCLAHPCNFETARASAHFNETMKTVIHLYKYRGRTEMASPLGRLLWETLLRCYDADEFDLVIPVPLHWFRQYRRGFNQTTLMVQKWAQLACEQSDRFNPEMISEKVLYRRRNTLSQTGLGKRLRAANLKEAFVVRRRADVFGKRILLLDDVMTTGATADACAKVLKAAGAVSVKVLTVARAV